MTAPMPPQVAPQAPPQLLPAPTPPWSPFAPRPNDGELLIAQMWAKRLSEVISTVQFDKFGPEWQQPLLEKYQAASQVVQASIPPQPLPKGVVIQGKAADASGVASEEQAALHPNAPQSPQPAKPPTAAVPQPGAPR
jgi:hypothetical protein